MKLPRLTKGGVRFAVKEAFDNLPAGICFFSNRGLLVQCNRQMYRISREISGSDVQTLSEFEGWLKKPPLGSHIKKDGDIYVLHDGRAWIFERREIDSETRSGKLTEYIASDITELYNGKIQLDEDIKEQEKLLARIEKISHNIAIITRNEEALRMKMQIHNDLGAALNFARNYLSEGCPKEGRDAFIERQSSILKVLLGETRSDEDNNPLDDLYSVAEGLGLTIEMKGEECLTPDLSRLLSYVIRECLTNTISHAGGDTVYVDLHKDNEKLYGVFTNNGEYPCVNIVEGGGLSSLREKLERCGGTMSIRSLPVFCMDVTLPLDARDD